MNKRRLYKVGWMLFMTGAVIILIICGVFAINLYQGTTFSWTTKEEIISSVMIIIGFIMLFKGFYLLTHCSSYEINKGS